MQEATICSADLATVDPGSTEVGMIQLPPCVDGLPDLPFSVAATWCPSPALGLLAHDGA
jgi:hypothetical protein